MAGEEVLAALTGGALSGAALAGLGAFLVVFIVIAAIVMLAIYIYTSIALMAIAKRTKTKNGWLAFIPIANIYLMTQIAKLPAWYTFGIFLVIIPGIGGLAVLALMIYIWWKIAEALGKEGWWGILAALPIIGLVVMGILAWGKK